MPFDPSQAKSIFLHIAGLPTAAERSAYLDQACDAHPELRARVEQLLVMAAIPDSLLDRSAAGQAATQEFDLNRERLDFLEPGGGPDSRGRLGNYEILEVVGQGGMGIVLRATDLKLNRVVAIKVLAPELASIPQARKRFLREAQAAAAISHDHVVTIHAVDEGSPLQRRPPFLVMEYVVGQSLQEKIDQAGALKLKETLRIGMQIAWGLAAAHRQGLVHRDIKPANILLENGVQRVKITDFGLARASDDLSITQTGQIAGTPQYMSPEQAQGKAVDQRSDLFSLGSVLYTMCTGRPAFRGDSALAVLRRVCDDTPRPIAELNPETPDWLIDIINRLLAKEPENRPGSAAEIAGELEQWLAYCQQPEIAVKPATKPLDAFSEGTQTESKLVVVFVNLVTAACMFAMWCYLGFDWWTIAWVALITIYWCRKKFLEDAKILFAPPTDPVTSRGSPGQTWHDWWSSRDQWIIRGVQVMLLSAFLACVLFFISMSSSSGKNEGGKTTYAMRLGAPAPWFQYEVNPAPNVPFRMNVKVLASSMLIGLIGCVAYCVYWKIETVRNPRTLKWNSPGFVFGVWGVAVAVAIAFGLWQGGLALQEPQTPPGFSNELPASGLAPAPAQPDV